MRNTHLKYKHIFSGAYYAKGFCKRILVKHKKKAQLFITSSSGVFYLINL